jgi:SAM-dependent methyltransferase
LPEPVRNAIFGRESAGIWRISGYLVMRETITDIALSNLKAFGDGAVIQEYVDLTPIMINESIILRRLKHNCKNKKILEIGVGGGRLTPALFELSKNYIGIDWSEKMISRCRDRFPHISFVTCDARDLSRFENGSIDLIVFSFNGIDYLDHSGRMAALREIYRVMSASGVFVFSSHNRRCSNIFRPWQLMQPWRSNPVRHPRSTLRGLISFFICCINHLRNRRYERNNDEFSIVNDQAHYYTLMTYYVDVDKQINQLNEYGFQTIEAIDFSGHVLSESDYITCQDTWIYYVCRKGGRKAQGNGNVSAS